MSLWRRLHPRARLACRVCRTALVLAASFLLMLCGVCFNLVRPKQDPCIFCNIREDADFGVVKEDSQYVMFMDKWPGAAWHYLVVPKAHIESVQDLGADDVGLIQGMLAMGKSYFDSQQIPESERRFGFHIPPFTSVDHIHLHCFGLPFKGDKQSLKYFISKRKEGSKHSKGWGWFIEVEQAIHTLQTGGKIRISPC